MNYALAGLSKIPKWFWNLIKGVLFFIIWIHVAIISSLVQIFTFPIFLLQYWGGDPKLHGKDWIDCPDKHNNFISKFQIKFYETIGKKFNNISYNSCGYYEGERRFVVFWLVFFIFGFSLIVNSCVDSFDQQRIKQEEIRKIKDEEFKNDHPVIHKTIKTSKETIDFLLN